MRVDRCKKGCTHAMMVVLPIRDVGACFGISKLLRESKIDHIDQMCCAVCPHHEVGRFHVAMNEITRMDKLDTGYLEVGNASGM
jgi:hypothetical protein